MNIDRARIPGTPEYFRARAEAFSLINALQDAERASNAAFQAHEYAAWDTSFEEFDGSYDEFEDQRGDAAMDASEKLREIRKVAKDNLVVLEILKAQNRLELVHMAPWQVTAAQMGTGATTVRAEHVRLAVTADQMQTERVTCGMMIDLVLLGSTGKAVIYSVVYGTVPRGRDFADWKRTTEELCDVEHALKRFAVVLSEFTDGAEVEAEFLAA